MIPIFLKDLKGEDSYDIFISNSGYGYNSLVRNNLQFNRRNGMFSEIGIYSNVFATDWSWCPLWMDFNNDGLKDLFVTNGIPKRLNDIDYINYVSNMEIQSKIKEHNLNERDMALIDKFPQIKIPNKFYENSGEMVFRDLENQIQNDQSTYSNGAAYADFDNDGDLDIVVNNIDHSALLYENKTNDQKTRPFLELTLKGPAKNINALGSKLVIFANKGIRTYEKYPVHGFLSSMETPLHIGLYDTKVDSAFLIWPDNTYQRMDLAKDSSRMTVHYKSGLPKFDYGLIRNFWKDPARPMKDITHEVGLRYKHEENPFAEFEREPLLPHMFSTEGPALAVGDINEDGKEDIFIGSSKTKKRGIFVQEANGLFRRIPQPALELDSMYEDVDAAWVDVNHDGHVDLVLASGGNEYYGLDEHLTPRVYLGDGKNHFTKSPDAFDSLLRECILHRPI
jgi:hypothetical protein